MSLQEVDKLKILSFKYIEKKFSNHITIPEVSINNRVADYLSINGEIHIYELKSKKDTLTRLKEQLIAFKKSANKVTIIADEKFKAQLLKRNDILGVGIILVNNKGVFTELQKAQYRDITDSINYINYWSPIEIRETLRGFKGWYKFSTIEAMNKLIDILNIDELRRLTIFRLKEKFLEEYMQRKAFIKEKEYKRALQSRYKEINTLKITPLLDIPISVFKDFS